MTSRSLSSTGVMLDHWLRDLRHAVRGLRARPAYTLVSIFTLTLVIGAASAVFCRQRDDVRPLPFPRRIDSSRSHSCRRTAPTSPIVRRSTFACSCASANHSGSSRRSKGSGLAIARSAPTPPIRERHRGRCVARRLRAVRRHTGYRTHVHGGRRSHQREGRRPQRRPVAAAVRRRPTRVGRTVSIDREPHLVIGVMPVAFQMAYTPMDLWTPLNASEAGFTTAATLIQVVRAAAHGRQRRTVAR